MLITIPGIMVMAIAILAMVVVGQTTAVRQRWLAGGATAAWLLAIVFGYQASNSKAASLDCRVTPTATYLAWALGTIAVILAIANLTQATKSRALAPIVTAGLFVLASVAGLALVWFLSIFCFTF